MTILKIVYDNDTKDVLDLVNDIPKIIVESHNFSHYKERKNAIPILTRHGAKKLPFIAFADENLEEYTAYWTESKKELTRELIQELCEKR